jgi:hypothetical protein
MLTMTKSLLIEYSFSWLALEEIISDMGMAQHVYEQRWEWETSLNIF